MLEKLSKMSAREAMISSLEKGQLTANCLAGF